MEESIILYVISAVVVGLISYAVKLFWDKKQEKMVPESRENHPKNVDELIGRYGDPDDIILLDPTRGNEASSAMLVYDDAGFFVINGAEIRKSDIEDVTFYNNAIPYFPNEYYVVIKTKDSQGPLRLHAGNDGKWAAQVVEQVMCHLQKKA